jgi:cytochrome P450
VRHPFVRSILFYEILTEMTDKMRFDQLMNMFFGGHETTGHMLTAAFHYLAQYPDWYTKIREEAFEKEGVFEESDRPLLHNFLKEVLRFEPPVPIFAREAVADIELRKGKWKITRGTQIILASSRTHFLPEFWGDTASEFNPHRFEGKLPSYQQWVPFGSGRRSCVGRNLSLLEAKILLDRYFHSKVRFNLASDTDAKVHLVCTARYCNGLKMTLVRE